MSALKNRYVADTRFVMDCPKCDPIQPAGLKGFKSIDSLKEWALEKFPIYLVGELYDVLNKKPVHRFDYEYGRHSLLGILHYVDDVLVERTVDNGQGVLIWRETD